MKYNYLLYIAFALVIFTAGCKKDNQNAPSNPIKTTTAPTVYKAPANFRVVGYMLSGDIASGAAKSFNTSRINYLNITFSDTSGHGTIPATSNMDAIISAAHKNNTKVLASIGDDFVAIEFYATESARAEFISNLMASITKYQFDGVDVDLEGGYLNSNYEVFVGEISAALKLNNKLLTAAVATWETTGFTDKSLTYFDYVNVMSYDNTGPWDPSDPGQHSPYSMAVSDLNFWTNTRGIAAEKLNLGVPFYGYGFGSGHVNTLSYAQVLQKYPDMYDKDQFTEDNGYIFYFNGIPTIKEKTKLAMQSAGGIMIWELMYDTNNDRSLLTAIDQTANPGNN